MLIHFLCCLFLSTNFLWIFMLIRGNTSLHVELKFNDPLPVVCRPLTDLAFQHCSRFAETRQTEKSGCWLPLLCCWHWYMSLFSHKFAVILMLTQVGLLFLVFFLPIFAQGPCFARFLYFKVRRKKAMSLSILNRPLFIDILFIQNSARKSFKKLFHISR